MPSIMGILLNVFVFTNIYHIVQRNIKTVMKRLSFPILKRKRQT